MIDKIFGKKHSIQRRLIFELSLVIIFVIIISTITLYFFTHKSISEHLLLNTQDIIKEKEIFKIFELGLGIIIINTFLISTSVIKVLIKIFAKPFEKCIEATKKVAEGDFSVKLETDRNDETRELVDNFNRMVKQLGQTEIIQKDFIDNVSHEIKTPINSIQGFAKLLEDTTITEEERKTYVNIIIEETNRLLNLSNNILKLAKLQHQDKLTNEEEINLSVQIKKAVMLLEPKWKEKNINFSIDAKEAYFYGDEDLLFQMWTNILDNAIKFSNQNGKISVSIENINDDILVKIKDNGIGMDAEELEMIYKRFYQIDKSHSGEGSGLGLSIVKRIVELSKGKIDVESVKGKGTTFIITLPKVEKTNKIMI